MKLTDDQRKIVATVDHTVVVACPGSGKTRTLVARLLRCIDDVRETPRRVGCITYTNTAVYEIENRLRIYGSTGDEDYCEVSTIHAFCLNNVLRQFAWKLENLKKGYTILPPECDIYAQIVDEIAEKYNLDSNARATFEQINRRPDGAPITSSSVPPQAAVDFWTRLESHGYVDFCNIVYYSYRILKENPSIARALACRFAHILVDEFQDTSALQVEILSLIAANDLTKFFLVGDPEQSIYSFAGAERELMFSFSEHLEANDETPLLGNFRSSAPVVACAERIRPRTPPMYAAGSAAMYLEHPLYLNANGYFEAITDHFLPAIEAAGISFGETAILSPQWPMLRPIAGLLREYSVPVVGPGARPYRRSHLFARLAEQVCAYLSCPKPELVKQAEKELYNLLLTVTGRANFGVFSFAGRRTMFQLLRIGQQILMENESGIVWLRQAAMEMGQVLYDEGMLPIRGTELVKQSVEDMIADMQRNHVDISQLSTADLGMFADPQHSMKLMTIHTAKGREFDAVAIIGVHDGIIPYHNQYNPITIAGIEEGRRLFYVAATRARRLLMFFTDKNHWRGKSRYLKEIGF